MKLEITLTEEKVKQLGLIDTNNLIFNTVDKIIITAANIKIRKESGEKIKIKFKYIVGYSLNRGR